MFPFTDPVEQQDSKANGGEGESRQLNQMRSKPVCQSEGSIHSLHPSDAFAFHSRTIDLKTGDNSALKSVNMKASPPF